MTTKKMIIIQKSISDFEAWIKSTINSYNTFGSHVFVSKQEIRDIEAWITNRAM